MVEIGIVGDTEVVENRDSEDKSLMITCELSQEGDDQLVERYGQSGEDYNPPADATVVVVSAGRAWKIAIACEDGIESITEQGERLCYSSDGGARKATIFFKKDGTLQLNSEEGTGDFAVRFNELQTAFDQLKSDFNSFVTSTYNLHNHPTAPTGPVSVPSALGSASSADVSDAKVDSITVPEYVP